MCCGSRRRPLSRSTDREENIVFAAFITVSLSLFLARLLSQSLTYHYSSAHDRLIHIDCRVATADRGSLWCAVSTKKGCMKAFDTIETFHEGQATRQLESAVARSSDRLGAATWGLICISLDRDAGRFGLGGGDDDASRALDRGNRLFGGGKLWRWELRNSSSGSKTHLP